MTEFAELLFSRIPNVGYHWICGPKLDKIKFDHLDFFFLKLREFEFSGIYGDYYWAVRADKDHVIIGMHGKNEHVFGTRSYNGMNIHASDGRPNNRASLGFIAKRGSAAVI